MRPLLPSYLPIQLVFLFLSVFEFQLSIQQLPIDIYNVNTTKDNHESFLITLTLPLAGVIAVAIIGIGYLVYTLRMERKEYEESIDLAVNKNRKFQSAPDPGNFNPLAQPYHHDNSFYGARNSQILECDDNLDQLSPHTTSSVKSLYDPPPSYSEVVL